MSEAMSNCQLPGENTISRLLVHKWSIEQVLLNGYRICSDSEMVLTAQLPRSHSVYCEFPLSHRRPDLAVLIEICRQACFVVAHEQYDVPLENSPFQFLFQELIAQGHFPPASGPPNDHFRRPSEALVQSRVEKEWKRGSNTSGLLWRFQVFTQGEDPLATVRIRQTWIKKDDWSRMRAVMRKSRGLSINPVMPSQSTIMPPAAVGRISPSNVLLHSVRSSGKSWHSIAAVDVRHPVYFDHSIDHIYAMVQAEACRQLAFFAAAELMGVAAHTLEMTGCLGRFISTGEFDLNTELDAELKDAIEVSNSATFTITISQNARLVSEFEISVRQGYAAAID